MSPSANVRQAAWTRRFSPTRWAAKLDGTGQEVGVGEVCSPLCTWGVQGVGSGILVSPGVSLRIQQGSPRHQYEIPGSGSLSREFPLFP